MGYRQAQDDGYQYPEIFEHYYPYGDSRQRRRYCTRASCVAVLRDLRVARLEFQRYQMAVGEERPGEP